MSDSNFSLVNMDGLSDVAIKLLEMIENAVGWAATPRGSKKDLEEALQYYKKSIIEDDSIPSIVKASKIASAKKDLNQYINQGKIITHVINNLNDDATFDSVDSDWLSYYFDYAKNIRDETIQIIWARLLAEQCNGSTSVQRNLIHILSLMDTKTALAFTNMCRVVIKIPIMPVSITIKTRYIPQFVPVIVDFLIYSVYFALPDEDPKKQAMLDYQSCIPTPEQLAMFKELGLINILENEKANFTYPYNIGLTNHRFEKESPDCNTQKLVETTRKDFIIKYFDEEYIIVTNKDKYEADPENILLGLIQFTSIGEALYKAIKVDKLESFSFFLEKCLELQELILTSK